MTAGRPTKYDPAMCEAVLDFMSQGYSKMAAAGHIGVCYNTLRAFMDEYPEFLQAVKHGEAKRVVFLEQGLLQAETGPQVTSRIFALKNAAPDEWRDKQVIEGPGPNGEHVVTMDVPDDVRSALDAIAGKITGGGQPG